jgi:beta-lactamase regulating signal transducer with metallopeptidase domain
MKKFIRSIRERAQSAVTRLTNLMADRKGDLATNTIGAIIIAVVIIGLLIVAINSFFPSFFTNMFQDMSDKLNANW